MMAPPKPKSMLFLALLAGCVPSAAAAAAEACEGESCPKEWAPEEDGAPKQGSLMLQSTQNSRLTAEAESEDGRETAYTSLEQSRENERRRAKLVIEGDLSKLGSEHFRAFDATEGCSENAAKAFDHHVKTTGLETELNQKEEAAFKARFVEAVQRDCEGNPDVAETWFDGVKAALERQKPIMAQAVARSINAAQLSYKVRVDDSLVHETAQTYAAHHPGFHHHKDSQLQPLRVRREQHPMEPCDNCDDDDWDAEHPIEPIQEVDPWDDAVGSMRRKKVWEEPVENSDEPQQQERKEEEEAKLPAEFDSREK